MPTYFPFPPPDRPPPACWYHAKRPGGSGKRNVMDNIYVVLPGPEKPPLKWVALALRRKSEWNRWVCSLRVYFDLLVRRGLFRLNMHQLLCSLQTAMHKGLERKMNIGFLIRTFWELIRNYISWYSPKYQIVDETTP